MRLNFFRNKFSSESDFFVLKRGQKKPQRGERHGIAALHRHFDGFFYIGLKIHVAYWQQSLRQISKKNGARAAALFFLRLSPFFSF